MFIWKDASLIDLNPKREKAPTCNYVKVVRYFNTALLKSFLPSFLTAWLRPIRQKTPQTFWLTNGSIYISIFTGKVERIKHTFAHGKSCCKKEVFFRNFSQQCGNSRLDYFSKLILSQCSASPLVKYLLPEFADKKMSELHCQMMKLKSSLPVMFWLLTLKDFH